MKMDISFPTMFRGTPDERHPKELYVHAYNKYQFDVPEVSIRETQLASTEFRVSHLSRNTDGIQLPSTNLKNNHELDDIFPELRSFNGQLYRKIGDKESYQQIPVINEPILRYIDWRHALEGVHSSRNFKLWPKEMFRIYGHERYSPKNSLSIESTLPQLKNFNAEDISVFERMHEVQMDKLLIIDGELWMQTPPPSIVVSPSISDDKKWYPNLVKMNYEYYPDYQDVEFGTVRFPLDRLDAALEYACELEDKIRVKDENKIDQTLRLEGDIFDPDLFAFEQDEDELFRYALVLAGNLVRREEQHRFHYIYADHPPLLAQDMIEPFQVIRDETFKTNMMLGERGNLVEILSDIEWIWGSIKRLQSFSGLGRTTRIIDIMKERSDVLREDSVISVETLARPKV